MTIVMNPRVSVSPADDGDDDRRRLNATLSTVRFRSPRGNTRGSGFGETTDGQRLDAKRINVIGPVVETS